MSQLGMFDVPPPRGPDAKVEFLCGVLDTWYETMNGKPPRRPQRAALRGAAEQCVFFFHNALLMTDDDE